jgi:uncharacterized membrane protein
MPKSAASPLTTTGRIFFALAILGFGVQYALYGHLRIGLPVCPPWLHHNQLIAYSLAAILAAAGISMLSAWRLQATALILALLLLLTSALYLQRLNYILHDGGGRTVFLECLSLAATALILHGLSAGANAKLSLMPGRILFAFAMIVFGAQHFMYARFVATLIPAWIPQHYFWTIFTGIALIAAGISIATTIADKYAAYGLFVLFFGWLVLLHIPRILHALHSGDEWSSGFVVLALSGASLLLADSSTNT